jgi:hypothetical protein
MQHLRFLVPRCLLADPHSEHAVLSVDTGRAAFPFLRYPHRIRQKNNKKARSHMARAFLSGPQDQVIT